MEISGPHIVENKQKRFMFIHTEEEKAQKNKHRRGIDINSFIMYERLHRHFEKFLTF